MKGRVRDTVNIEEENPVWEPQIMLLLSQAFSLHEWGETPQAAADSAKARHKHLLLCKLYYTSLSQSMASCSQEVNSYTVHREEDK